MARIFGTTGNDTITGWIPDGQGGRGHPDRREARDDVIDGRSGDDVIDGGTGHDLLIGGAGRDTLNGGNGDDTILPAGGAALPRAEGNVVDGGNGRDWVSYEDERFETVILSLDGSFSFDRMTRVEHLRGGAAGDRLTGDAGRNVLEGLGGRDTLFGGRGQDTLRGGDEGGIGDDLHGGAGADVLEGGRGQDFVDGGAGADSLLGGEGADVIDGGRGDDRIQGGLGADVLVGGRGANTFVYATAAEGGDVILDFRGGRDQVEISAAGFGGGLVAGQDLLATGAYIEDLADQVGPDAGIGQFHFDRATGVLRWDVDGSGAAAAIVIFELTDPARWRAADLTIV